jgi:hypothetical protein
MFGGVDLFNKGLEEECVLEAGQCIGLKQQKMGS